MHVLVHDARCTGAGQQRGPLRPASEAEAADALERPSNRESTLPAIRLFYDFKAIDIERYTIDGRYGR